MSKDNKNNTNTDKPQLEADKKKPKQASTGAGVHVGFGGSTPGQLSPDRTPASAMPPKSRSRFD